MNVVTDGPHVYGKTVCVLRVLGSLSTVYHSVCAFKQACVCPRVSRCVHTSRLSEGDKVVPACLHSSGTKGEFHVPLHLISRLFCCVSSLKERKWVLETLTDNSHLITKCKHWYCGSENKGKSDCPSVLGKSQIHATQQVQPRFPKSLDAE